MTCGIYQIKNLITGDSYIGSSKQIEYRWRSHLKARSRCLHLKAAIKKYRLENFKFEILEECSEAQLIAKEQEYLDKKKPTYNIAVSAGNPTRGRTLTVKTREAISKTLSGRKLSISTKEKIRVALLGNQHTRGLKHTQKTKDKLSTFMKKLRKERGDKWLNTS